MPDDHGPWQHEPAPPTPWHRWLLWLAFIGGGALLLWLLFRLFPSGHTDWEWSRLIWIVVILGAGSRAILAGRHFAFAEFARNVSIWVGIAAVLVLGYAYKDEFAGVASRVRGQFLPSEAQITAPHTLTITASEGGHFFVYGEVEGTRVQFMIDTGASDIVLSPEDARRVGIDTAALDFRRGYETANGVGGGAPVMLASLTVGPIRLNNVPASVNRAEMTSSLLGMAFLNRLDGFEVHGDKMLLHWR